MTTYADEIMSLDELVDYLKVSKSTLYKLVQRGHLPGKKIGKQWRFHKEAVDAWLKNQTGQSRHRKKAKG
jgi:excisionase family DNA binding protein